MTQFFKRSLFLLVLSFFSSLALAGGEYYFDSSAYPVQPNLKLEGQTMYRHTAKSLYFYLSYVYTYRFLTGVNQTLITSTTPPFSITYSVNKDNTPRHFNGIMVGIGKALSKYFDLQIAYLQDFREDIKFGSGATASANQISMKGFLADLLYIFNPDDRFKVGLKAGVTVADFDEKITNTSSGVVARPIDDSTEINPNMGMDMAFQITKHFGMRMDVLYTLSNYRHFYNGDLAIMTGISLNI